MRFRPTFHLHLVPLHPKSFICISRSVAAIEIEVVYVQLVNVNENELIGIELNFSLQLYT